MEKRAIIAIGVVAVLVIGGLAYVALSNNGDDDNEQESKGGWYSWNPKTFLVASSNVAPSPYWVNTIEMMYEGLYGSAPSYDRYAIKDVPSDFLSYESLVSYNDLGQLVVKSKYADASKNWSSYDVTFDKMPTGGIGTGSFFVCLYYALCEQAGVDPMAYDSNVIAKMWKMAFGGDEALYSGLERNYNIPVAGFNGVQLPNPSKISDNKEKYVAMIDDLKSRGEVPVWLCSGSSPAYENGGQWMRELMETNGFYAVTFSISTFSDCLAEIEAIAHIFGMGDTAKNLIDNLRVQMYTLYKSSEEQVQKTGHAYTGLGTYTNSDWTFADKSGMGEMFYILHIKNVYTKTASGNWEGENVIRAQPEVILFCMSNPSLVDWNQAMRVPAETVAS